MSGDKEATETPEHFEDNYLNYMMILASSKSISDLSEPSVNSGVILSLNFLGRVVCISGSRIANVQSPAEVCFGKLSGRASQDSSIFMSNPMIRNIRSYVLMKGHAN
jgi:hypothetical protein